MATSIQVGQPVKVTRYTDRAIDDSVGVVTGQETIEGVVAEIFTTGHLVVVAADDRRRVLQITGPIDGPQGYPVISVEAL